MKNIDKVEFQNKVGRHLMVITAILLPLVMFLFMAGSLSAQGLKPTAVTAATLEATKAVSSPQAQPGDTLQYTIIVSNTGDTGTSSVEITDTVPIELSIISSTISVVGGGNWGVNGQVITWSGGLNANDEHVTISFDAVLTDTASTGAITNTALITGTGSLLAPTATFDVVIDPPILALTKTVNTNEARPGDALIYEILLQNSGGSSANNMVMTDTLSTKIAYISGTLIITGTGSYGVNGNVITWTGSLTESESVTLQFNALITDTLVDAGIITNTVYAVGAGHALSASVQTSYVTTYTLYMPIIFKPLPAPTLTSVSLPTTPDGFATYRITASWTAVDNATSYELWESTTSDFSNPTVYSTGIDTSYVVSHPVGLAIQYYYCAVALGTVGSGCSNVMARSGLYVDNFNSSSSGWAIRRQDTDDADNSTYYGNGNWNVKIRGRWDYAVTSSLQPVPPSWASASGYRIDTRVILGDGIDNLHSYGLVFGGDINGSCPPDGHDSNCFNHYYRLNILYHDSTSLIMQLKRIDYHDPSNNAGRGVSLIGYKDVYGVNPNGWNNWTVKVYNNGAINIYANGALVGQANDTRYVGNSTYFGTFASSNEYSGTLATYDYYRVSPLP